jgi:hydroxymethylbilane synthase
MTKLRIGTRGSALALWQARTVAALIEASGAGVELVVIRTAGDRLQQAPLSEVGGKRLFVKEIEDALLAEDIDIAVHSAKDMSAVLPAGLEIGAVLPREDPRDAIVLRAHVAREDFAATRLRLEGDAVIGTGSVRRAAQLRRLLPHARFAGIRGTVDTRLRKLESGDFDALVLAAAGMRRLGLDGRIAATIPLDLCVPAPGQGIIAVEMRAADAGARRALAGADDPATGVLLTAERALVERLGGGCQLPLGAIAMHDGESIRMHGLVASPDGRSVIRRELSGPRSDAAGLACRLADALAAAGALEILDVVRAGVPSAIAGDRSPGDE